MGEKIHLNVIQPIAESDGVKIGNAHLLENTVMWLVHCTSLGSYCIQLLGLLAKLALSNELVT